MPCCSRLVNLFQTPSYKINSHYICTKLSLIGSGELDFGEFAVSMENFLTMDVRALAQFFFEVYDFDKSNKLSFKVYDLIGHILNPLRR